MASNSARPADLSQVLLHEFADARLLARALTHSSASGNNGDYQRLEFLGDRVLALAIADLLLRTFPDEPEGSLARRLNALVRKETLAEVARQLDLGVHFILDGEDPELRENDSVLADVCEALIGALYLDGGMAVAQRFIASHWQARLLESKAPPRDPKTALQEWAQARGLALPRYRELQRHGPPHAPVFTISVAVDEHEEAAEGSSKRMAEQRAARRLLARLERDA